MPVNVANIKKAEAISIPTTYSPPVSPSELPGSGLGTSEIAGEDLGGHRIVKSSSGGILYADNAYIADGENVIGMTQAAALAGAVVPILTFGVIELGGWAWNAKKPLFLGNHGLMIQVPPESGFVLVVAYPVTQTKILIKVETPIYR